MQEAGQPFEIALPSPERGTCSPRTRRWLRASTAFAPALVEQYLGGYAEQKLGMTVRDLLALGRQNPDDSSEAFNMAYLAIRGSGAVNGVSRLHGKVSRNSSSRSFRTGRRTKCRSDT